MLKKLTILFCLISVQIFGQREISLSIEDFNSDGFADTLRSYYDGGSGFGGRFVTIINGKNNEIYELTNYGCFCEIKQTILIPPALNKIENRRFLEIMKIQLLPESRSVPECSLDWIIKSSCSNVKLESNTYFDLILDPQTTWTDNKFEYPKSYYIQIKGDTLNKLFHSPSEIPEWYDEKQSEGFLIYYAQNHYRNSTKDSIILVDSDPYYKVFRTSHGVLVKKDNLYKWVFISDVDLTGAPEKLRWESIKKVKLIDNYLILQQDLPPNDTYKLFVINIETGLCGRLKFSFYEEETINTDQLDTFIIQDEKIILSIKGNPVQHTIKEIFNALEEQYITKNKQY